MFTDHAVGPLGCKRPTRATVPVRISPAIARFARRPFWQERDTWPLSLWLKMRAPLRWQVVDESSGRRQNTQPLSRNNVGALEDNFQLRPGFGTDSEVRPTNFIFGQPLRRFPSRRTVCIVTSRQRPANAGMGFEGGFSWHDDALGKVALCLRLGGYLRGCTTALRGRRIPLILQPRRPRRAVVHECPDSLSVRINFSAAHPQPPQGCLP